LKKLGFLGGCGIASAPSVFQKLWRGAFNVNHGYPISSAKVILPVERQALISLGKTPFGKNRLLNR